MVINSLVFWESVYLIFIMLPSFLHFWTVLPGKVFVVGNFFSFSILHLSSYSLPSSKISFEKSTDNLIRVPFYGNNYFLLVALKILSLILVLL